MKQFISSILLKLSKKLNTEDKTSPVFLDKIEKTGEVKKQETEVLKVVKPKEPKPKKPKPPRLPELSRQERAARDITEMMEVPFLALSKNRREPIIYEKHDGPNMIKVKVSRHTGHFLASIYDWDIVLFVAGRMQEILNKGSDIPPRTMIVPRHELLKSIRKHDGKKEELDLRAALSRLKLTGIETTIRNEDGRYAAGFGFLESWSYTDRKDIKEIRITLSDWLYDGICAKSSLLLVDPEYFSITSALKRFLYRTARKHAGGHGKPWEFLIETLYKKSGSEMDFRFFKRDLKAAVSDNDVPGYFLRWIEKDGNTFVSFKNLRRLPLLTDIDDEDQEENPSQEE
jgi:plasmid replication initiation protein